MRKRKFRIWDGAEMHYTEGSIPGIELAFTQDGAVANAWSQGGEWLYSLWVVDVLEWSGLEDLFEGDIVKHNKVGIGVVVFDNGSYKVKWIKNGYWQRAQEKGYFTTRLLTDYNKGSLIKLGNTYQNPDLIK